MKQIIDFLKDNHRRTPWVLLVAGISLILSYFHIGNFGFDPAYIAVALCGLPIILGAIKGLVNGFNIKAGLLVSVALIASLVIQEVFAAGEVAFIMALGEMLEERTVAKSRAGIEKLIHMKPTMARILRNGNEVTVPAEKVQVNDILRVNAGETIPVDGIITQGNSAINQAIITGESIPVDKQPGDEVLSGTLNQFGTFDMKATRMVENSSLQRMIQLVESASAKKAKIARLTDKWATWIVFTALLTSIGTWFFTGEILRSVTILVVFCPCALVLATPTAIMAGIGNVTKFGILVRQGDALERLAKVKKIIFDKTGTLTYGKPEVTYVHSFNNEIPSDTLLSPTASAESRSEHPLGKAIVDYYRKQKGSALQDSSSFLMYAGRGVSATVNEHFVMAGNEQLFSDYSIPIPAHVKAAVETYRNQGGIITYIAIDEAVTGFIVLADVLRKEAASIVRKIQENSIHTILLTGDHTASARYIAQKAGIQEVYAECLPEDKLQRIQEMQNKKEPVCMIGDGVNDAPALKAAYVSVAMGGVGSDIAIVSADITFVNDDIHHLPHLLNMSRKTMNTIKLNLAFSMLFNFVAIYLAMTGILNPVTGALAHNAGSLFVVANSALLLTWKKREICTTGCGCCSH